MSDEILPTAQAPPQNAECSSEKDIHVELEHKDEGEENVIVEEKWAAVNAQADRAEEREHSLGFWQSVKLHRKAVFWAFTASLSIIMEGYDTSTGGGAGLYEWRKFYGKWHPDLNDYQLDAGWQGALSQAGNIGNILGIILGTWTIDRFGYKKCLLTNYIAIIPFIGVSAFAVNKPMLLIGGIFQGIPFGTFSTLAEAYASEICPLTLRAYLTGWVNVCWVLGAFVASGVTLRTQSINSQWSFRIPMATQWVWPLPLIALMSFAPESPWWLVRHGRFEQAEKSIRRLESKEQGEHAPEQLANMIRVNQLELEIGKTRQEPRWVELFKGTNLRRTEIACITFILQNACGVIFVGQTTYVFEQAGISQGQAYKFGFGNSALQLVANFFNFWLLHLLGRRTIMLTGYSTLLTFLIVVGICAVLGDRGNSQAKWAQAGFTLVYNFCFTAFVGPVTYAIVSEVSSTRLRNKTIGLARMVYIIYSLIMYIISPLMINPTAWGWGGNTAWFWVPWAVGCVVWTYFRLPEFKHRSYYELDILFNRKTPTRKFKSTVIEQDAINHEIEQSRGGEGAA